MTQVTWQQPIPANLPDEQFATVVIRAAHDAAERVQMDLSTAGVALLPSKFGSDRLLIIDGEQLTT